jgi:hypothetical protein
MNHDHSRRLHLDLQGSGVSAEVGVPLVQRRCRPPGALDGVHSTRVAANSQRRHFAGTLLR